MYKHVVKHCEVNTLWNINSHENSFTKRGDVIMCCSFSNTPRKYMGEGDGGVIITPVKSHFLQTCWFIA